MEEIIKFLKDLSVNNNRIWFADNKARYLKVKGKIDLVASMLIAAVSEVEPEASHLSVKDCTYRIYRDTRFSADKTPYKTHVGIFVNPPYGKKGATGGYYLHIEPGNCMFAAGNICHPPAALKALRRAIFDNIEEYREIVESEDFKKIFYQVGDNFLKTAPKGFPKDYPFIDYLRPRDFVAYGKADVENFKLNDVISYLRPMIAQAKRYNSFINFTLEDFSH